MRSSATASGGGHRLEQPCCGTPICSGPGPEPREAEFHGRRAARLTGRRQDDDGAQKTEVLPKHDLCARAPPRTTRGAWTSTARNRHVVSCTPARGTRASYRKKQGPRVRRTAPVRGSFERGGTFVGQIYIALPLEAAAVQSAFNFPVWGSWEKLPRRRYWAGCPGHRERGRYGATFVYSPEQVFQHRIGGIRHSLTDGAIQLIGRAV